MRAKHWAIFVVAAGLALGCGSSHGNKYSKGTVLLGVVKLGPFPAAGPGVAGYSLYMAEKPDGEYKRINTELILPLTSLMVPYLNVGQDYYFRMTSLTKSPRKEGAQGQTFSRKAAANQN